MCCNYFLEITLKVIYAAGMCEIRKNGQSGLRSTLLLMRLLIPTHWFSALCIALNKIC